MRASLVTLVAALAVLVSGCPERVDPAVQEACDQVLVLEETVLELYNEESDDPEVLGQRAGAITRDAREVRELAEEAGHESLRDHAALLTGQVMPAVAMSLLADGDQRGAASLAARVVVDMRAECRQAGAID